MRRLGAVVPRGVPVVTENLFELTTFDNEMLLPLIVQARSQSLKILAWIQSHLDLVHDGLIKNGGVLFRGFSVKNEDEFSKFVRAISSDLLEYKERSTPRTEVGDRIYTSTEYPAHQSIALHNEFSYAYTWPMKIFFFAMHAPTVGGETPIADSRRVYEHIPSDIRERFIQKGVMYVRNYGTGIDLSWQEAFQTDKKEDVETYCLKAPLKWEWLPGDRLRTVQVRPSVAKHPVTNEMVWFNQAHLFHVSNLGDEVQDSLQRIFDPADLPRNAFYGDGSEISEEDLGQIRLAYEKATVAFPWQEGDLLVLDNMLVAHGRKPYKGQRRILAALAEPYSLSVKDQI
jgi:alpha-ketoglutarate-dependent taurine dioxygenase